ncbi:hypothetical protein PDE_06583 [Penicillium oxalicum 114-2]|uniref:NB-ARC domain-containing protein n=1 Tax=Penicillium oxalicum (strain 114-2 / CGMCC 5302) TaxID=933388 RepID=S8AYX5_PENO1|nr:hypothetical protein PDE_06583 [Penicillium oxalicum 114-2]
MPLEMAAAELMLDIMHPSLPRPPNDHNIYILGSIGKHNVVIARLPTDEDGGASAAVVGMQLLSSFPAIRFGLLVGMGGVPSSHADIRLGDVVVGQPTDALGGVIQYDLGQSLVDGQLKRSGMLNRPSAVLLAALATLQAHHLTERSQAVEFISSLQAKAAPHIAAKFTRPMQEDCLFQAEYDHVASGTCNKCDRSRLICRPAREHLGPVIHYGLIGSVNQAVKDSRRRDQPAQDLRICYLGTDTVGLMNEVPCLFIRGVCDYADSHKNEDWQGYAAAAAAAYAKELLLAVATDQINSRAMTRDTRAGSGKKIQTVFPQRDPSPITKCRRQFTEIICPFRVPFDSTAVPAISNLVGRQDEVKELWEYLQPTDTHSRKIAVIYGLGGIGKTEIAIHLARECKHDFSAIFWLRGKDRGTLLRSLSSALPRLPGQSHADVGVNDEEVEQRAKDVLKWLATEGNSRWLMIFDNIEQYCPVNRHSGDGYDIAEFFPEADHGSILITTRQRRLAELGRSFPTHKLDSTNAIQLLLQSSHLSTEDTTQSLADNPDAIALVSRLDGLPLAIVLAGAFMRETGTSITEYLEHYETSWSALQLQLSPDHQYQQGNLLETWLISFREIERRDADAAKLLLFLARFDNRDIWFELIKNSSRSPNLPRWLERTISSEFAFQAGARALIEFSLLEAKEHGGYAIHPVVQDWCIHLASTEETVDSAVLDELALISVGYTVPKSSDRDYVELQQRLLPHANRVRQKDWPEHDAQVWGAVLHIGTLYQDQGNLTVAEEMCQRALVGFEKASGPDDESTLGTVNNLGLVYYNQGKLKAAEEMYQRALAGFEKTLGPDHTSTLGTVNNLGLVYSDQGNLEGAEAMYQRALIGQEKALGPDHMSTLVIVNNLGIIYSEQGNLKEAERMYQRALVGQEKTLGLDHVSTLRTVNNLGVLYMEQEMFEEAEKTFQRELTCCEKTLGPTHSLTLDMVNNAGKIFFIQEDFKKAEEMCQRALAGYGKAFGPDHPSTLATISNLGSLFRSQRKFEEAEEMYQRALAGYEKALGSDHPSTLSTAIKFRALCMERRNMEDADERFKRAFQIDRVYPDLEESTPRSLL